MQGAQFDDRNVQAYGAGCLPVPSAPRLLRRIASQHPLHTAVSVTRSPDRWGVAPHRTHHSWDAPPHTSITPREPKQRARVLPLLPRAHTRPFANSTIRTHSRHLSGALLLSALSCCPAPHGCHRSPMTLKTPSLCELCGTCVNTLCFIRCSLQTQTCQNT